MRYVLLTLALIVSMSAFAGASEAERDEMTRQLEQLDYSDLVAHVEPIPEDMTSPFIQRYDKTLPREEYTTAEGNLLYGWKSPKGYYLRLTDTLHHIERYYREISEHPSSGADLVRWATFGGDTSKLKSFLELPKEQQLDRIGYAVNPATGRLFESFADQSWRPHGVVIRLLESTVELQSAYQHLGVVPTSENSLGHWQILVFDDIPDTVLAAKAVEIRKRTEPLEKPAGWTAF